MAMSPIRFNNYNSQQEHLFLTLYQERTSTVGLPSSPPQPFLSWLWGNGRQPLWLLGGLCQVGAPACCFHGVAKTTWLRQTGSDQAPCRAWLQKGCTW